MDQFLKVLAEFEQLGGTGVVYGGCLRDTICGIGPIKDIDIAVENTPENLSAIDRCTPGYLNVVEQFIGYGNFPDVYKSVQLVPAAGPIINLVVLGRDYPFTKQEVARRCDFGLCQVSLDRDGLYTTEAFQKDKLDYTFTYLRDPLDEAQFSRSKRRFERFTERYVGWRLVVPS